MSEQEWRRGLLRIGDALAGLATTSCESLRWRGLIAPAALPSIQSQADFCERRGCALSRALRRVDRRKLLDFCKADKFLLAVFEAASKGQWAGPRLVLCPLPELPTYIQATSEFVVFQRKCLTFLASSVILLSYFGAMFARAMFRA